MPTVRILPDTGNIEVTGAPDPQMRDYIVTFGWVFLTRELAEQAKEYGWEEEECPKGELIMVRRSQAAFAEHALPNL